MMKKQLVCLIFLFFCFFIKTGICWEAILERYVIKYKNTKIINGTGLIFRYNRTTVAGNAEVDLYIDLPSNAKIVIQLYGLYSNKYTELPIVIARKVCDVYKYEYKWIKNELNGEYPKSCPIKKGHYYVRNYVPNVKLFPAKPWDTNNYMIDGKLFVDNKMAGWLEVYVRTTTNDEIKIG